LIITLAAIGEQSNKSFSKSPKAISSVILIFITLALDSAGARFANITVLDAASLEKVNELPRLSVITLTDRTLPGLTSVEVVLGINNTDSSTNTIDTVTAIVAVVWLQAVTNSLLISPGSMIVG
jgi:hypothetical protein